MKKNKYVYTNTDTVRDMDYDDDQDMRLQLWDSKFVVRSLFMKKHHEKH